MLFFRTPYYHNTRIRMCLKSLFEILRPLYEGLKMAWVLGEKTPLRVLCGVHWVLGGCRNNMGLGPTWALRVLLFSGSLRCSYGLCGAR